MHDAIWFYCCHVISFWNLIGTTNFLAAEVRVWTHRSCQVVFPMAWEWGYTRGGPATYLCTCQAHYQLAIISHTRSKFLWREHKVPITHIHGCHLLIYEQQLPSTVLSHCHYSLAIGKGQDITYDLQALEKDLLDQFIHSKPLIISDIPQVSYRKDVYTAATFAAIRKNIVQVSRHKILENSPGTASAV